MLAWASTAYFDAAMLTVGKTPRAFAPHRIDETMITVDRAKEISITGGAMTGEVRMWGGTITSIPSGWKACNM